MQRDTRYKDIAASEWFREAYEGRSLGDTMHVEGEIAIMTDDRPPTDIERAQEMAHEEIATLNRFAAETGDIFLFAKALATWNLIDCALDALAREQRDALREEIHKDEKLLPNSFGTVRERVVRDEFAAYIRLTPAQVAAMDDGAYHQLDLFRDDAGVRWLIDGKDPTP